MAEQNQLLEQLLRQRPDDVSLVVDVVVKEYHAAIYRLACSILFDPEEAADAAQETFITAALKLDQYQVGTNFRAWLYTIAVNHCRGYLRKRNSRQTLIKVLQSLRLAENKATNPESTAMQAEAKSEIWTAVASLDEKYRLPIELRILHTMRIQEIAQILGIKEKTVYTRLYQGFRLLRSRLGQKVDWGESISPFER